MPEIDAEQVRLVQAEVGELLASALTELGLESHETPGGHLGFVLKEQTFGIQTIVGTPTCIRTFIAVPRYLAPADDLALHRACNDVALLHPIVKVMVARDHLLFAADAPLMDTEDLKGLLVASIAALPVAVDTFKQMLASEVESAAPGDSAKWDWLG